MSTQIRKHMPGAGLGSVFTIKESGRRDPQEEDVANLLA